MSDDKQTPTIERLFEVLNSYGSASGKWPETERDGLEKLLKSERKTNQQLNQIYQEARALDHLLNTDMPDQGEDLSAISTRIMARIAGKKSHQVTRDRVTRDRVTDLVTSDRVTDQVTDQSSFNTNDLDLDREPRATTNAPQMPPAYQLRPANWRVGTMLAATFLLGIYVGATLLAEPAVDGVAALTGSTNSAAVEFTLFASEPTELFGEEL